MARPVVGGHFAFLTLERACGGQAVQGLEFLEDDDAVDEVAMNAAVERMREGGMEEGEGLGGGEL